MKKTIITLVVLVLGANAFAQDDAISKFFNKYLDDENFTQVTVTSRMFGLFANLDAEEQEDQELLDAISKVKGLRILARDEIAPEEANRLYKEAFDLIPAKDYEELMTVKDKDTDMKFLIKESDQIISELLMVSHGDSSFFLLSLVGDIDLKQISRLSRSMDIEGFDKLQNIEEKKNE